MKPIDYFKLQAKNLHKDYKSPNLHLDKKSGHYISQFNSKYFDLDAIMMDFNFPEGKFSLMNAQHVIARLAGFEKWQEVTKASEVELALGKLLFENMHKISIEEWQDYIAYAQFENNTAFDVETKLEIFEKVFATVDDHASFHYDYWVSHANQAVVDDENPRPLAVRSSEMITSLPLSDEDRKEFIEAAKKVFEEVLERIEPEHPEQTRELWDAGNYIDKYLLKPDMLPISKDYALSLIESFLVHH